MFWEKGGRLLGTAAGSSGQEIKRDCTPHPTGILLEKFEILVGRSTGHPGHGNLLADAMSGAAKSAIRMKMLGGKVGANKVLGAGGKVKLMQEACLHTGIAGQECHSLSTQPPQTTRKSQKVKAQEESSRPQQRGGEGEGGAKWRHWRAGKRDKELMRLECEAITPSGRSVSKSGGGS